MNLRAITIALSFVGSVHSAIDSTDILAGALTGLLARGVVYVQHQGSSINESMGSAGATIGLLTMAIQKNKQNGSMCGGMVQMATALLTFFVTAHLWPITADEVSINNTVTTLDNNIAAPNNEGTTSNDQIMTGSEYSATAIWEPGTFIEVSSEA